MKKYIMALDQGTTSSRCILFDMDGNECAIAQQEYEQIFPKPGWVEHDPIKIWSSQLSVATGAMAMAGATVKDIAGIGITNQRETTICWDKTTGIPVYNAIVWQCRRTADMITKLNESGLLEYIRSRSGLIPDAYFSASKIAWILDNVDGARKKAEEGSLLFGTVDTWILWNLTKGKVHATDYTNASRTMLFNIYDRCWDEELLRIFNIPKSMLPKVYPSSYIYGCTDTSYFGGEIPIAGIAGDQQAALFGQCCFDKGEVKNTYGTGCFLLMNTGDKPIKSAHGLITTMAASADNNPVYALEGSVFIAGAGIQWLRDSMRMIRSASQTYDYAISVTDTQGVYVVPAFSGIGAPYWNQYCKGMAVGMTRGCKKEHFIRATLEAIAYQSNDVIKAMEEDSGISLARIKVDGGASANDFLMQFQADISNSDVIRPSCVQTTALGAAYLAGLATGCYNNVNDIKDKWRLEREFNPSMDRHHAKGLLKGWEKAVKCALYYGELGKNENI